ncbi:hypothetical protein AB8R75_21245, partial [Klebsiella quasipneumoniae subsp. similipneumoniae]|uniref:hypothetical protein n=1 Tax=Klebsiella quasipneumoniae TaxID=1463165 RepID=UPI0038D2305F
TGKLTVGKSQLLAHPVTHSGFRLQHDDLTSRTYSHLPKRSQRAPHRLFPADTIAHTMIAFDIISGEYRDCSDSLEYIDRQRSALSEKRITIHRTWHYCRRTGFRQPTIDQPGLY